MTNATRQFIRERLGLMSDQEIFDAAALLSPVTERMIPLDTLAPYLRKRGLMAALKLVLSNPQADDDVKAGISEFLDHLADQRVRNLDTTDPEIADKSAAVLNGLKPIAASLALDPDQVIADIYAMGGGLAYSPVTLEIVAAERLAAAKEIAGAAVKTRVEHASATLLAYLDGVQVIDAVAIAAAKDAFDAAWEASG